MKFKYLSIFLLLLYNLTLAQVPGTPRLMRKGALSQAYILGVTKSDDLNSAIVTGFVLNNGQSSVTTCGIIWGTNALLDVNNSDTYMGITTDGDINGANSYSANLTNLLDQSSTIYISAYASNSYGTFYSSARRIQRQVVTTGTLKTWMTTNLGATAIPESITDTSGYGFLFQWGRKADGHQIVRPTPSGQTVTQSNAPSHGLFILGINQNAAYYDWRSTRDESLWGQGSGQVIGGVNNPCPTGFRLPTSAEFKAETDRISPATGAGGFASSLALTYGGERRGAQFGTGDLRNQGILGTYWTRDATNVSETTATYITFRNDGFVINSSTRADARSVRCIKNY